MSRMPTTDRGVGMASEPDYAGRADYSPLAWHDRVKAALTVQLDRRRGRDTPAWISDLAEEAIAEVPRPTRRSSAA